MKKTRRPFARRYVTFEQWDLQTKDTEYSRRIRRKHALYPNATLAQLGGRPTIGEKSLRKLVPVPLWQLRTEVLSANERRLRRASLEVISKMRETNIPLSKASAEVHISPNDVVRHAGSALQRAKGDFYAKAKDAIPRAMKINHGGKEIIVVIDSENASIVGQYQNAKKELLVEGDGSALKAFVGMTITDITGAKYSLDTGIQSIVAVEDRREEREFYSIYAE